MIPYEKKSSQRQKEKASIDIVSDADLQDLEVANKDDLDDIDSVAETVE